MTVCKLEKCRKKNNFQFDTRRTNVHRCICRSRERRTVCMLTSDNGGKCLLPSVLYFEFCRARFTPENSCFGEKYNVNISCNIEQIGHEKSVLHTKQSYSPLKGRLQHLQLSENILTELLSNILLFVKIVIIPNMLRINSAWHAVILKKTGLVHKK